MRKRQNTYYPKQHIINDLYTEGEEYMVEDTKQEYIGFYHMYITGEVFTESEWNKNKSVKLIPLDKKTEDTDVNILKQYEYINGVNIKNFKEISSYTPIPSQKDYKNGFIDRYFISKVNDSNYPVYEVSKDDYEKFGTDKGLDNILFKIVKLPWKLTGVLNDEIDEEGNIVQSGVFDTNKRIIQKYQKDIPNLYTYLTDPLEFSIYSIWYERQQKST